MARSAGPTRPSATIRAQPANTAMLATRTIRSRQTRRTAPHLIPLGQARGQIGGIRVGWSASTSVAPPDLTPCDHRLPSLRLGARLRLGRAGLAGPAGGWSAVGCPVGDQTGDGQVGLGVVVAAAEIALQGAPLLVFGVGVLDADPLGGLLLAGLLVGGQLLGWRVVGWFGWRATDLVGERLGQAPVAGIDRGVDVVVSPEQVLDALGLDCGLVVHPAWSDRAGPKGAAGAVADGGDLDGVLLALARDKRPPPTPVGPGSADLGLGPVKAQLDAAGGGVGEHVRQGPQAHARHAGDGEASLGQQWSELVDRAGDGVAVHAIQHRQRLVGQLQAQLHQGDQDPVAEDELVVGPGADGTLPRMASPLEQGTLVSGGPRVGEFGGQLAKVLPRQPGEARMGEGRTGPCWLRHPRMITRAARLMRARRYCDQPQLSRTKS